MDNFGYFFDRYLASKEIGLFFNTDAYTSLFYPNSFGFSWVIFDINFGHFLFYTVEFCFWNCFLTVFTFCCISKSKDLFLLQQRFENIRAAVNKIISYIEPPRSLKWQTIFLGTTCTGHFFTRIIFYHLFTKSDNHTNVNNIEKIPFLAFFLKIEIMQETSSSTSSSIFFSCILAHLYSLGPLCDDAEHNINLQKDW